MVCHMGELMSSSSVVWKVFCLTTAFIMRTLLAGDAWSCVLNEKAGKSHGT